MKTRLATSMLAVVLMLGVGNAAADAVPPNDDIEHSVIIPVRPYVWTQSTLLAGTQVGEPLPCGAMGATIWFSYTPVNSGFLIVDTDGSSYDTVLAGYSGSPFLPTLQDCDDDSGMGLASLISFPVTAGVTYYIQAGGFGGQTGVLVLKLNANAGAGVEGQSDSEKA